jgi:hypothetical protein
MTDIRFVSKSSISVPNYIEIFHQASGSSDPDGLNSLFLAPFRLSAQGIWAVLATGFPSSATIAVARGDLRFSMPSSLSMASSP